ncbi:MAG: carbohydrate ABC transporter substrate-binding protein [Geminicoccaceae bacterium]|nr:carbohydrate ABC transporter substrate-binding protein [Geminicoccaceae bacterium]
MNKRTFCKAALLSATALVLAAQAAVAEPKVNMLHQWYRGSDAEAIKKLGEMFEEKGGTWEQTSVAGHTANTIAKLRADVVSGNAPPAVQLKGPEIAEWAETGLTADLNEVAAEEHWDDVVAPELVGVMKPGDTWVAAPMNIHRINWMWISKPAMDKAGVTEVPKTWDEFNAMAEKMKAAGINPVGHSSQDWIDATLMEVIVYGQDIDLYRKAFLDLDLDALRSDGMVAAFDQLRKMVNWTDKGMAGRQWDGVMPLWTAGDSGVIFQGDWSIGTYNAAGLVPDKDYVCAEAPKDWDGTGFILNADSVIFFKQDDPDYQAGQMLLASTIMSPEFQLIFNQAKGSIPARMDVTMGDDFNPCQLKAAADLEASIEQGTLVRTMAHNMAVAQKFRGVMLEVITEFVNTPDMASADAAENLALAVEDQM